MTTPESVSLEMAGILRLAAGEWPGASMQVLIRAAARALCIDPGRAKRLWYREARCIPAHEADNLRAWHRAHLAQRADRLNAELAHLRAQLDTLNDGDAA